MTLANHVHDDISPHCMFRSLTPLPSPLDLSSNQLGKFSFLITPALYIQKVISVV